MKVVVSGLHPFPLAIRAAIMSQSIQSVMDPNQWQMNQNRIYTPHNGERTKARREVCRKTLTQQLFSRKKPDKDR